MDRDLKGNKPSARNWVLIILILVGLWLGSAILANLVSIFKTAPSGDVNGNVAIIPVKGVIRGDSTSGAFSTNGASSRDIVQLIERAGGDDDIEAVILEINSPGGSAVASHEIAKAVKNLNKTSVAWIREVGASGAYWVASASDHIVADRLSTTGSIGVLASYLEYGDLLERWNITYERLVGGEYKDLGTPFRELEEEERDILQDKIDRAHQIFIEAVAENRNMSVAEIEEFASGLAYFGEEAHDMGLVDEIGGKDEAIRYLEKRHNITAKTVVLSKRRPLINIFGNLMGQHGYYTGVGLSDSLTSEQKGFIPRT